MHTDICYKW